MYAVRNSARALLVASVPLVVVHAVLLAMALLATQTVPPLASKPAPDEILIYYFGRVALDCALLFAGHLVLQQRAVSSRTAYATMGGVVAACGHAIALRNGLLLFPPGNGSEITLGLLPTVAGGLAGFLYGQFAGIEPAANWPKFPYEAPVTSQKFDGPVRVRTSIGAVVIAAIVPAVLTAILIFGIMTLFLRGFSSDGPGPVFTAAIPAQMFLTVLVATIVPSAIFVLCAHHIARVLGRNRGYEYAAIGSLMAGLCTGLIAPLIPVTSMFVLLAPAVVYGAIMGALYRRFAGIEPVPLPEVVIVTDEAALVGADHPSRQQHGVILTN